jgi:hypothetical protein
VVTMFTPGERAGFKGKSKKGPARRGKNSLTVGSKADHTA